MILDSNKQHLSGHGHLRKNFSLKSQNICHSCHEFKVKL